MAAEVAFAPAYLLQHRPYRETSELLEVFCAEQGRVGLVARGVRGSRSKARGALQPFRPLLLSWRDTGELGTMTAVEPAGAPLALAGERVFLGWYVNELLIRLLQRRDPHPGLFPLYAQTLASLAGAGGDPALRRFEKRLLEAIGYGLDIGDDVDADTWYRFDPEHGALPAAPGPHTVSGAALADLRDERFDVTTTRKTVRLLLRDAIDRQLGGRALESRRMLQAMRDAARPPA